MNQWCIYVPGVMPLLHCDVCDARLVVGFQFDAGLPHSRELVLQHCLELTFAHAVTVQDYTVRLEPSALIELNQQLLHHR